MMLMSSAGSRSVSYDLSIKTQFAPVETHVAVCEVLRRLQQEFGGKTCTSTTKAATSTAAISSRCCACENSSTTPLTILS